MELSRRVKDSILKFRDIAREGFGAVFGPGRGWCALGGQLLLQFSDRSADLSSQLNNSWHILG